MSRLTRVAGLFILQIFRYVSLWVARYESAVREYHRRVPPRLARGARAVCRRGDR